MPVPPDTDRQIRMRPGVVHLQAGRPVAVPYPLDLTRPPQQILEQIDRLASTPVPVSSAA